MAALSAGSIAYTMKAQRKSYDSRNCNLVQMTFGDGTSTYPTGGIPVVIGNLGCPTVVESMDVVDAGTSGYFVRYDSVNQKLMLFHSAAHTHNLLLKNAVVANGATTAVNAGANLLGANTGADITVAGGGASGGIVNTTIGPMTEVANTVAPASMTLVVEVIGW